MTSPDFLTICVAAFTAVFIILILLALMMILIIRFFPPGESSDDPVYIAALSAVIRSYFPDKKIQKIEDIT
jgi:Co/Zn/Cd efflux system component